jgi:hypothetical protein
MILGKDPELSFWIYEEQGPGISTMMGLEICEGEFLCQKCLAHFATQVQPLVQAAVGCFGGKKGSATLTGLESINGLSGSLVRCQQKNAGPAEHFLELHCRE